MNAYFTTNGRRGLIETVKSKPCNVRGCALKALSGWTWHIKPMGPGCKTARHRCVAPRPETRRGPRRDHFLRHACEIGFVSLRTVEMSAHVMNSVPRAGRCGWLCLLVSQNVTALLLLLLLTNNSQRLTSVLTCGRTFQTSGNFFSSWTD